MVKLPEILFSPAHSLEVKPLNNRATGNIKDSLNDVALGPILMLFHGAHPAPFADP